MPPKTPREKGIEYMQKRADTALKSNRAWLQNEREYKASGERGKKMHETFQRAANEKKFLKEQLKRGQ